MIGRLAVVRLRTWSSAAARVSISAGLVALVIWLASPGALIRSAPLLPWRYLATATGALVVGLYFADAYCVYWLFAQPDRALQYSAVLTARGSSYLLTSLNYELGQGAMAWSLAGTQRRTFLSALGMCALLVYHDVGVLLALGCVGGLLSAATNGPAIARSCALALLLLVGLGMVVRLLPARWQERWLPERWRVRIEWWTWRHSAHLGLLRMGYFAIFLVYAALGLRACGFGLSAQVVCSVVPLVLLADGLPISVSGLGTREATLLYLIHPEAEERAILVAFSLLWSVGLVLGRAAIGLGFWWFTPTGIRETGAPGPAAAP
jgi:hypothetical protein